MTASTSPSPPNSVDAPHLPFDIVAEILSRLPVQHLLQLRCVCKSWNSLISLDFKFAKNQLSFSTSNKDCHRLFLSFTRSSCEFLLCHSPISSFFTSASIVIEKQPVTLLLNNQHSPMEISTCDGILCFEIDESLAVLYNPSTRKFKMLPPLKTPKQTCFPKIYTLGYDHITSNYKIIATVTLSDRKRKTQVNIHTLGTDYWTRIQDIPCSSLHVKQGIFVNDTVNWLVDDTSSSRGMVIVSLDLEKESYQKLSIPLYDYGLQFSTSLGALRGCLSMLAHGIEFASVWIMKEYGNDTSWTKLFSFPHTEDGRFYYYQKVLYISEDDQLLMEFCSMGEYGLVVYDSITNTFTTPKMQNNIHDLRLIPYAYVESLISPF